MKKTFFVVILVVSVHVTVFAERTWPTVGVLSVSFSTVDYSADRQQVAFSADDGNVYYYKHEGEPTRVEFAQMYMSLLLTAKATGKKVKLISDDGYAENHRKFVSLSIQE